MSSPHRLPAAAHPLASISPQARIGCDCRIDSGAVVPADCELGDEVHVGPNVVFVEPDEGSTCRVGRACARVRIGYLPALMLIRALLFVFVAGAFALAGCRKDTQFTEDRVELVFSQDTILYDTIFTTVGTITKRFHGAQPQ